MKVTPLVPPRRFPVGKHGEITLSDCGRIELDADELVTFVTPAGRRYDLTAKSWGFYATPSVNARLKNEGFKTALVRNADGRIFVLIVEPEGREAFETYLRGEQAEVLEWLDERA